ncbi:hypothetical protein RB623_07185 [Mesorhizobium sp. LHD-90]|uniref:hypothetical protein n=1 Tax=Mesorhizobium sp. LHD-90 TaxID=3071414 RepID=UPI0027E0113F|nr:hypothetical protein [Mesorhizobium sp. LHD-90]MDQ6433835.1 hypothetical protein [Mesorhizobium sp. LHD-90]
MVSISTDPGKAVVLQPSDRAAFEIEKPNARSMKRMAPKTAVAPAKKRAFVKPVVVFCSCVPDKALKQSDILDFTRPQHGWRGSARRPQHRQP